MERRRDCLDQERGVRVQVGLVHVGDEHREGRAGVCEQQALCVARARAGSGTSRRLLARDREATMAEGRAFSAPSQYSAQPRGGRYPTVGRVGALVWSQGHHVACVSREGRQRPCAERSARERLRVDEAKNRPGLQPSYLSTRDRGAGQEGQSPKPCQPVRSRRASGLADVPTGVGYCVVDGSDAGGGAQPLAVSSRAREVLLAGSVGAGDRFAAGVADAEDPGGALAGGGPDRARCSQPVRRG